MPLTSVDIYPLARRLYALMPEPLRRWTGMPVDAADRDRLADACLDVLHDAFEATEDDDENAAMVVQMTVISEALAGLVCGWGCRYGNLDDEVGRAQAALVTALGGVVHEPGIYQLREGTPITVAAIAHLIGWVCILDVPECDETQP